MVPKKKIAVILAAHGEAETTRFMENYRVTSRTLAHVSRFMPMPTPLQKAIALSSSMKKLLRARTDPQCSPQNRITREQAEALQLHLDALSSDKQFSFEVHAAFSASPPYVEQIIEQTRACDGQVIISMAPVDTSISCGQLCSYLACSRKPDELGNVRVLGRFWDDERLHAICRDHLFEHTSGKSCMPSVLRDNKQILLLLFHGTLVSDVKGDVPLFRTGLDETTSLAERLRLAVLSDSRNSYDSVMAVYLNHDVGGTWTKPSFSEICTMLRQESGCTVDLFGCGYFSDGNETIRRADELRLSTSIAETAIIPCLNSSPSFIAYLSARVTRAARQIAGLQ